MANTGAKESKEKIKDFRAYCTIKQRNVGILADCQFCEADCLRINQNTKFRGGSQWLKKLGG